MQETAERWKPEAAYFTTFDGRRTAFFVFDMPDASAIPPFAEPFFQELDAEVQISRSSTPTICKRVSLEWPEPPA